MNRLYYALGRRDILLDGLVGLGDDWDHKGPVNNLLVCQLHLLIGRGDNLANRRVSLEESSLILVPVHNVSGEKIF